MAANINYLNPVTLNLVQGLIFSEMLNQFQHDFI